MEFTTLLTKVTKSDGRGLVVEKNMKHSPQHEQDLGALTASSGGFMA
jgi:hypothetical protein